MKQFSQLEKDMIDKIIEIDEKQGLNILGNILQKRFSDHNYYIQLKPKTGCSINITEEHFNDIAGDSARLRFIIEQSSKDVVIAVNLIKYLENEGLAYTVALNNSNLDTIGPKISNASYIEHVGIPLEIETLLRDYIGEIVIPTQSLKALRDKKYRTDEEIRFNRQWWVSIWAAFVSAIAVLVALFTFIFNTGKVTSTKIVNIPKSIYVNLDDAVLDKHDAIILDAINRTQLKTTDVLTQKLDSLKNAFTTNASGIASNSAANTLKN